MSIFINFIEKRNTKIKKRKICYVLTSIPSLFIMVASIFKIAVLMDLGGGSFVIPMLIAFDLLWFRTIISLFLFISCCFCLPTTNEKFSVILKHLSVIQPRHSLRYYFVTLEVIAVWLVFFTVQQVLLWKHTKKLQNIGTCYTDSWKHSGRIYWKRH